MSQTTVAVGRRRVEVSRPDKVLYPDDGITKDVLVDTPATLVYLAGQACITVHAFLSGPTACTIRIS